MMSSSSTRSPILPITNKKMNLHSTKFHNQNESPQITRLLISPSSPLDSFHDSVTESKPLLSKAFSFTGALCCTTRQQQRRRRAFSDENLLSANGVADVDGNDNESVVEHVATETFLVTRWGLKLLSYLGLDLYLPKNIEGPKPVVAFITGGAWIIGYKAWGSLLGQQLAERGIIVACIDYRNFPQGTMRDMIDDASRGISFICNNIAEYGGDPNRVYLMGQSAGAHIAACALVEQAIKEVGEGDSVTWSVSQIKAYFGLSGGYNMLNLVDYFHNRGLYRNLFLSIMEGEHSLGQYSPEVVVQDPNIRSAVSLLPPVVLFHGTGDYSIPSDSSESFAATLQRVGVDAQAIMYEGKTHTDVFLQDPMRGGNDQMFEDLVSIVHAGDEEALAKDATALPRKRLVPEIMLKLARAVSPF